MKVHRPVPDTYEINPSPTQPLNYDQLAEGVHCDAESCVADEEEKEEDKADEEEKEEDNKEKQEVIMALVVHKAACILQACGSMTALNMHSQRAVTKHIVVKPVAVTTKSAALGTVHDFLSICA